MADDHERPLELGHANLNEDELEVEALGLDEHVQELRTSAIAPCATHNRQVTQANLEVRIDVMCHTS
jgi:hypothetical protein